MNRQKQGQRKVFQVDEPRCAETQCDRGHGLSEKPVSMTYPMKLERLVNYVFNASAILIFNLSPFDLETCLLYTSDAADEERLV